ncbi:MAG: DNA-binding protein [Zoogloeaceae bacterium]|nr:DNA-binding protein [Zoogloeaceae bacterium]
MTPEQVKARFKRDGRTITAWAKEHGYNRTAVYMALNGQSKGHWGKGHEIAVALGLKDADLGASVACAPTAGESYHAWEADHA